MNTEQFVNEKFAYGELAPHLQEGAAEFHRLARLIHLADMVDERQKELCLMHLHGVRLRFVQHLLKVNRPAGESLPMPKE